jgi:hypothetical protein
MGAVALIKRTGQKFLPRIPNFNPTKRDSLSLSLGLAQESVNSRGALTLRESKREGKVTLKPMSELVLENI